MGAWFVTEEETEFLGKWVKNCYIFTTSYSVGINKLYEIAEEKIKAGILRVRASKKGYHSFIEFDDGETWMIKNPNIHLDGIRWDKCYIDAGHVTLSADRHIKMRAADPEKIDENLVYFNW